VLLLAVATSAFAAGSAPHPGVATGVSVTPQQILDALAHGRDAAGLSAAWREQHIGAGLRVHTAPSDSAHDELDSALRELDATLQVADIAEIDVARAERLRDLADRISAARLLLQERMTAISAKLTRIGGSAVMQARLHAAQTQMDQHLSALDGALAELQPQLQTVAAARTLSFADATLARLHAIGVRDALAQMQTTMPSRALGANPLPQSRPLLAPPPPPSTPSIQPSYATSTDELPTPDDQGDALDAPFAPSILARAQSLGYDYSRIFDFVRSTIDTQWYAGAQKGAEETLRTNAGNDVDQASLLVALLRASGAPARFVHGTIEVPVATLQPMLGVGSANDVGRALTRAGIANAPVISSGHVSAYHIEHTWVSARVPFGNYRGTTVDTSSATWIPLDTAIKSYAYRPLDAALKTTPIDRSALWHGYLQQEQTELPLAQLQRKLQDYLNGLNGKPALDTLTAKRQLTTPPLSLLPASLPYDVVAVTDEAAKLPADRIQTVEFEVYDSTDANANAVPVLTKAVPVRDLIGKRVTLSYIPATVDDHNVVLGYGGIGGVPPYLVHVRPRISVDGRELVSGSGDLPLAIPHRVSIREKNAVGEQDFDQTLISGGYTALVIDTQGEAPPPQADNSVLSGDSETLAAELLSNIGMRYSGAWDDAENSFGATLGVSLVRPFPNLLLVNNEIAVQQTAGLPTELSWKGVSLDAALRPVEPLSDSGRSNDESDWFGLASTHGSVLEHSLFEQQWSVDSISADKGEVLARAQNIPILTLQPGASTSSLAHPADVIALVQDWLARGLQVEIPQRQITVNAWTGSVWRVQDPASGANGYFISGNWAGGATDQAGPDWEQQFLAEALSNPYAAQPDNDPSSALRIRKLAATDYQIGKVGTELDRPLEVFVSDDVGHPVKGAQVAFALDAGGADAQLLDNDSGAPLAGAVATDVHGIARVRLKLGTHTGDHPLIVLASPTDTNSSQFGLHNVDAVVVGKDGPHSLNGPFSALARPDVLQTLHTRVAPISFPYPSSYFLEPGLFAGTIQVDVWDKYNNPVSNEAVTFSAGAFASRCASSPDNSLVYISGCDPNADPRLGSCGTPSATGTSDIQGAQAGVYLGNGIDTTYHIDVAANGTNTLDVPIYAGYPNDVVCNTRGELPAIVTTTVSLVNSDGELIDAAPLSQPLPRPKSLQLFVAQDGPADGTAVWQLPTSIGSINFDVTNGGGLDGYTSPSVGAYELSLLGAAQPATNGVSFSLTDVKVEDPFYKNTIPELDGGVGTLFYSAQINVASLDPAALTLQPDGTPAQDIVAHVQVSPSGYHPEITGALLEDGQPILYGLAKTNAVTQSAAVVFSRAVQLDPHKNYSIEATASYGTPFEIRADTGAGSNGSTPLPVTQGLFYDVDPALVLVHTLDVPNQYVCDIGANLRYSTTQDSQVTLQFFLLDTSGTPSQFPVTLLDNVSVAAGDHNLAIRPEDLPPGAYKYQLSGIETGSGQSDTKSGFANVIYNQFDSLPIGHPIVQGVDLADGHLTVPREDFSLGGRGPGLHFTRTYSSSNYEIGPVGRGWSMNYSSQIVVNSCNDYIVTGSEGQGMKFHPTGDGTTFTPSAGYHGSLTKSADGSLDFYAVDGTRYHYSNHASIGNWLDYIEDTNGNRVTVAYSPGVNKPYPSTVSDDAGRVLTFGYDLPTAGNDATLRLHSVTGPNGLSLEFDYAPDNYLSDAHRTGSGTGERHEHFVYGQVAPGSPGVHMLEQVQDLIGGGVWQYGYGTITLTVTATDSSGNVTGSPISFPGGNVISVTAPDNGVTTIGYTGDPGSNTPMTRTVTDGNGGQTTYGLNGYGAPVTVTDPAGTTTMTWDPTHIEPSSRTDKNGTSTIYSYDVFGNKTSELITSGDGAISRSWAYWDPTSFAKPYIKNRAHIYVDARQIDTDYGYDGNGNLTDTTRGGVTIHSGYAPNGDRTSSLDGRRHNTTYTFDAYGYPSSATDEIGLLGGTSYDALGRKVSQQDGDGNTTTFDIDALDRVTAIHYPATGAVAGSKTTVYNDAAHTRAETNELGHVTTTTFDVMGRTLSVQNAANDVKSYTYDYNGNRLTETDFAHNATTNVYDLANRVTDKHEPESRDTHYDYDNMGHVTRQTVGTSGDQRVTEYEYKTPEYHRTLVRRIYEGGTAEDTALYDGNGNAYESHDALGRKTTRTFDNRDRLTELDEPEGKITIYGYDDDDDRTSEKLNSTPERDRAWNYDARKREFDRMDGTGGHWGTGYDLRNLVTSRTAPKPNGASGSPTTLYGYDARHNQVSQNGPETGMSTTYEYDVANNRTKETWANGEVVQHEYDVLNRVKHSYDAIGDISTATYDANGNLSTETDANGNSSTHHYDGLNRKIQSDLPESRTLKWTYDAFGEITTQTDANSHVLTNAYDQLGHKLSTTTELTAQSWTYDAIGNVLTATDANGNKTTYTYDGLNRKKAQQDPSPLSYNQTWTYDVSGVVLTQIDRRGKESDWGYDAESRPLQHKRAAIVLETRSYDPAGNPQTLTDANGNLTTYLYDRANRKTDDLRPLNSVTHTTYYPIGDINTVTDPDGDVTTHTYDARRRQLTESNGESETATYTFDGNGNRTSTQRPLGPSFAWTYKYDGANRLYEVDDPLGHATTYSYDKNGNLKTQTDANGHVTLFDYDALNRRTGKTWPATGQGTAHETLTPDGNGNIVQRVDPNGQTIGYTYDALNRETYRTYSAATGSDIASETRTPDGNGNITQIVQTGADSQTYTTTRQFDFFDRLEIETDRYGNRLQYRYDPNGNRVQRKDGTDQNAPITTYTPDALNRITDVTPPNQGSCPGGPQATCPTHTDYFPSGRVHVVTTPTGLVSTTEYDRAGRVKTIDHKQNNATVANYGYLYDADGNRKQQDETNGGATESTMYTYDTADRLTDAVYPNVAVNYVLDGVGNRQTETQTTATNTVVRTATFNEREQITQLTDTSAPTIQYTYDLNGNLFSETQNSQTTLYRTNAQDRLATLNLQGAPPTAAANYLYDASGLRISKSVGGTTTRYRYDQQALIEETNTLNNLIARYDYTDDRQLAEVRSGNTNYFLHDALKSPIAQVTSQGAIAMRAQYDAWGLIRSESGSNTQAFGFTGYQRDRESGLYYAKARYYDPQIARFQSEDPELGKPMQPPSLHRYLYAYANPMVYVDPNGKFAIFEDGTGNDAYDPETIRTGAQTNVFKLSQLYAVTQQTYIRGVGTGGGWLTENVGGGTGIGVEARVEKGYADLVKFYNSDYAKDLRTHDPARWEQERQIDIFGFSRGSTEARILTNVIKERGIPNYEDPDAKQVLTGYGSNLHYETRYHSFPDVHVRFLGLFDTVDARGVPDTLNADPRLNVDPTFVRTARHAVVADEFRQAFALSSLRESADADLPPNFEEKAFRGAHSNGGGGYGTWYQGRSNLLANGTLRWMHDEAVKAGVPFGPITGHDAVVRDFSNLPESELQLDFIHDSREEDTGVLDRWLNRKVRTVLYADGSQKTYTHEELLHWVYPDVKESTARARMIQESSEGPDGYTYPVVLPW
jgi:RHS repeat-associated protein